MADTKIESIFPFRFHYESPATHKYRYLYDIFPADIVSHIVSHIDEYDIKDVSEKKEEKTEEEDNFNFEDEDYMRDDFYESLFDKDVPLFDLSLADSEEEYEKEDFYDLEDKNPYDYL